MKLFLCISLITVVYGNAPAPHVELDVFPTQEAAKVEPVTPTRRPIRRPSFPTLRPFQPIVFPALPTIPPIPMLPQMPTPEGYAPVPIVPPLIPQFMLVMSDGLSKIGGALSQAGGFIPLINVNANPSGVSVSTSSGRRRRRSV